MESKVEGRGPWPAIGVARWVAVSSGFVILTFGASVSGQSVEPNSMITLRVANYARIPDAVLAAAERTAQRVLHETGVDTRWLECPLAGASVEPEPRPGPADFFLTVVSKVMRERRSEQDALGFTLPCPQGRGGCLAYIFYPRSRLWQRTATLLYLTFWATPWRMRSGIFCLVLTTRREELCGLNGRARTSSGPPATS